MLERLAWPRPDACVILLDDGSTDETPALLADWVQRQRETGGWAAVHLLTVKPEDSLVGITSSRETRDRLIVFQHLATLRNTLVDACHEVNVRLQFSIDSDILVTPDTIRALARHRVPYCSTLVINDNSEPLRNGDYEDWRGRWGNIADLTSTTTFAPHRQYPLHSLIQVGMSGACFLADETVLKSGARYGAHPYGEDAWYALQLRLHDVPIYCDTTPRAVHVMEPGHRGKALAAFERLARERRAA